MRRRQLIQAIPLSVAGSLLYSATSRAQNGFIPTPEPYVDYSDWLEATRSAALTFIDEKGADDTAQFMQFLALWTTAMPAVAEPVWQALPGTNAQLDAATIAPGRPFVVTALRLAPGCLLPAHCHPGGGGISICTRGSLTIQHYDLIEGSPAFSETGAIAEVEEISITMLQQNQFTQFTPTKANLHQLQAGPDGAMVVDIIVQWSRSGEFSFLKFRDEPRGDGRFGRRHSGAWVGMNIADAYPEPA